MATFIEGCNCKGVRPSGVVNKRHYSRPEIIGKLLKDRRVARFLVAPTGFGKSNIAFEYANIIFAFDHVSWINGRSPCFLRDLDTGKLADLLVSSDDECRLVVCEDVPALDPDRAKELAKFIDEILDVGIEVIVTCTPSADTFSFLEKDRIQLNGQDLLLSDDEISFEEAAGRLGGRKAIEVPQRARVAALVWAEGGNNILMAGLRDEELPIEARLTMLVLLVLQSGSLDDIGAFMSSEHAEEVCEILYARYPMFGIDMRTRSYSTIDVPTDMLASSLLHRVEDLAYCSVHNDKDAIFSSLADMLIARGEADRACQCLKFFTSKASCISWLMTRGWTLLQKGEAAALSFLHEASRHAKGATTQPLAALRAWAALEVDDAQTVQNYARRIIRAEQCKSVLRIAAGVAVLRAEITASAPNALSVLQELISADRLAQNVDSSIEHAFMDWLWIARFSVSIMMSDSEAVLMLGDELAEYAAFAESAGLSSEHANATAGKRNALLFAASWLLERVASRKQAFDIQKALALEAESADMVEKCRLLVITIAEFVRKEVEGAVQQGGISWFESSAGANLESACGACNWLVDNALSPEAATSIHRSRFALLEQRDALRKMRTEYDVSKVEFRATHPDPFRRLEPGDAGEAAMVSDVAPTLVVNLFGGMEVKIGEEIVDPRVFSRKKVRTLLAILVINKGREVTRAQLAESLWGEASPDNARRNLYSLWSQLRKALTIDGKCPYLVRSHTGCSLDMRLVTSDVYEFDGLCRALLFGSTDATQWERLYRSVCEDYPDALMPSESENSMIVSLRTHYKTQLVDGLIAISSRLCSLAEPRGALWFAREAMRRDSRREDVYIALMEAQIASDQRSAAIQTFIDCRNFLSEEMGIDPSSRIVDLYRSIIEEEAVF